mgnify:CR=1 FL=1|tara:strand:- start:1422 stop:2801 length:1380 start_codon:yes stop_codon:yes gene_type:complete
MNLKMKNIPSVSYILEKIDFKIEVHENYLKKVINDTISCYRSKIKNNQIKLTKNQMVDIIVSEVYEKTSSSLVNIINGTGIVLHTGFGRAPFNSERLKNLSSRLEGYVNLEYNIVSGSRGDRQNHIRNHLSSLCNTESSLMVNNNAAAVLLVLNTISNGGNVICSRGQLVEIGGSFRIPDIIEKSGAYLKEVGTTNRTHLKDYENAIDQNTKLLVWVHTSNYVIKGFTKEVSLKELVHLGEKYNIPVMADIGSGDLVNMKKLGFKDELPVKNIISMGPKITTFSGDKLLGGPQCGLIVGCENLVKKCQKNPLYRIMRSDKISIALLDETLRSFRRDSFTKENLSLKMLTTKRAILKKRAKTILENLGKEVKRDLGISIVDSFVEAGSGSLPEKNIESIALRFNPTIIDANHLSKTLKNAFIPIIGYINKDIFYIDLKSVLPSQIKKIKQAIIEVHSCIK